MSLLLLLLCKVTCAVKPLPFGQAGFDLYLRPMLLPSCLLVPEHLQLLLLWFIASVAGEVESLDADATRLIARLAGCWQAGMPSSRSRKRAGEDSLR